MRALRLVGLAVVAAVGAAPVFATGAILNKSGPIQITSDGQFVWAVNPDHDSVSRLTTADNTVVQFALPASATPHHPSGLAITPDGAEVWVAAEESDHVFALDAATGALLATIDFPHGSAPVSVAFSPDGSQALVALFRAGRISVCDVAARVSVGPIEGLFPHPLGICYVSTPERAWVSHQFNDGENAYVTQLNLANLTVATVIKLASTSPKFQIELINDPPQIEALPEAGYLFPTAHIAQRPTSAELWMPMQYQNFHPNTFTPDCSIQSALHKVNLNTLTMNPDDRVVYSAVYAHRNNSTFLGDGWNAGISGPVDVAFDAAGATAYIVHRFSNDVLVCATNTTPDKPVAAPPLVEIAVGDHPIGIAASPTAERAYVLNKLSRDVSVLDLTNNTELTRVALTPGSPEPFAADVLLGAKLFNSSTDPRISQNQKIACASCHPNAETDGMTWDLEQLGNGHRKSLHLRGQSLSYGPQVGGRGQLHRSGDRDEIQDFDHTFSGAIMGGTGFLATPNAPLGTSNAGLDANLDAIAAYVFSLDPVMRSPHRAADGTLRPAALRGALTYQAASGNPAHVGCTTCHPSPTFTDIDFHDVGGFAPAPENEGPAFNTPSLVSAAMMFPFRQVVGGDINSRQFGMNLIDVVNDATVGGHGNTAGLSRAQRRDLAAFLESIDGDLADTGIAALTDTVGPRVLAVHPLTLNTVKVVFDEPLNAASAGDAANYVFSDGYSNTLATAATLDAALGNSVLVTVPLHYYGCDRTYTLLPGPIQDVAGDVGGGVNNELDVNDAANQASFTLNGTITVTFGGTGTETFAPVGRDASFQSTAANFSHTHLKLYPGFVPEQKGFVRFDFVATLASACGVTSGSQIVDARFIGLPDFGHAQTLELRRCFKPWGDPPSDFCFQCPGAVTRSFAAFPSIPWSASGAGAQGGSGTIASEYYPTASFDMAATPDATAVVTKLNEYVEFSSAAVTNAFQFWFDHPTKNFGYAMEVVGNTNNTGLEFWANEAVDGQKGFVLSITYTIAPETSGFTDCNENSVADECDIAAGTVTDTNGNGVPDGCEAALGDMNCDGTIDFFDIDPFLLALFTPAQYAVQFPNCDADNADANDDGTVDFFDIDSFLDLLFG